MVRSMMKCKRLQHKFWGEVVSIVTYIVNRSPTKKLIEVTHEAQLTRKPSVKHL